MDERENRILVVDDDAGIRTLVERVLRRERFTVDSARDGFEAIEKLAQNDYGTIILDLMMPRIDGLGVLQYLEQSRPGSGKNVIVMTANLHGAADARKAAPVREILPKPFEIRHLIDSVRGASGDPSPG